MSVKEVNEALRKTVKDEALIRHFLSVWPVVESILEAFSKATELPIFVYLSEVKVFQSSMQTMPPFCSEMLNSTEMASRCVQDGLKRVRRVEPDIEAFENVQYCHAGMVNGRCEIDTGSVGILTILFGSKKSIDPRAVERREAVIESASQHSPDLAQALKKADEQDLDVGLINSSDAALMAAIADIIQRLINATVGFRSLTINMAHELCLMMLNMGLLAREMETTLNQLKQISTSPSSLDDMISQRKHIYHECQLGLYVVRNFLSHTSETRYAEVNKPSFTKLDLAGILLEMVDLHKLFADTKNITFEIHDLKNLPKVSGSEMEISRLFHNILNNAIKYSYHSVSNAHRVIKIKSKLYDPGFLQKRFALIFENYGLGISKEESRNILKPGFRGQQAVAEVPIGSGIGLSEAQKIMVLHDGEIKVRSHKLHESGMGNHTYLTTVELIFPYEGISKSHQKR
ncbi:MAG TPA: ATP-binding protein [Pyrinomonadaceae bacterium]|nr:ATP-binding protein [Pyrinomonadaceae bacterium]